MTHPLAQARSFGAVADAYDRVRPGYPDRAVDALLPDGAQRAVDVGAGTGKLTAALVARGLRVIAVEPDEKMQRVLASRVPAADVRTGTAEHLPVEDDSTDAVVFGQSWHWTDSTRAAAEAARVLRSGGQLGLVWNMSDDRVPWVAELRRLSRSKSSIVEFDGPESLPGFCEGHRLDVAWVHTLPRDEMLALVQTWSSVSTMSEADRRAVVEAAAKLLPGAGSQPAGTQPTGAPMPDEVGLPQVCVALTYHVLPREEAR